MSQGITRKDYVLVLAGVIGGLAGNGIYDILKGSTDYPVVVALATILAMLFAALIMLIAYVVVVAWEHIHPAKVSTEP